MTTKEIRQKITEAAYPDWFNTIEETFSFPYINFKTPFKSVSAIYEFLNTQVNGWDKLGTELPSQLQQSKAYFLNIRNSIDSFVVSYLNESEHTLNNYWQNQVSSKITQLNQHPLPYSCSEVEFLIKVYKDQSQSFVSAFNYIVDENSFNANNKDSFSGMLLAYEFINKDHSIIVERRNAEKASLSKLKNDFQDYLTVAETQTVEHLNNANEKYKEYVQLIDELKKEKETLFNTWYGTTQEDFGKFDVDAKKKIKDLETSYEELLRLKKPAEYWKDRAIELKSEGWKSLYWLIGLVVLGCLILYSLLWLTPEGMLKSFFGEDKTLALRWTIIFITLLSFLAFGIRALTKVTFSTFHLARDAEERERLTYVYLAMIKDASVDKADRQLIMQSLFSRADTGLLKEDSAPTMPNSIIEKVVR